MAALEFFLLFVLGFEGISGEEPRFYHNVGDDVILPCIDPPSDSCSSVMWLYNDIVGSSTESEVLNGIVKEDSVNAARLSVDSKCSLIIRNIVPEDAGRYTCRPETGSNKDSIVHLTILSISPSQPVGDATKDGNLKLKCSLWRYLPSSCTDKNLVWVNDAGTQLVEDVTIQQQIGTLEQCVSSLTVKHPSTRYTCHFFERNIRKIEDHYPPVSTEPTQMTSVYIIGAVAVAGVLLLTIIAAVLFKCRKRTKESENQKNSNSDAKDPNHHIHQNTVSDSNLTYASLSHFNPKVPHKVNNQEDVVTYSAIKPKM